MLEGGVLCFGLVVGYITYRTLVRTTANAAVSDLATVIGAIGGEAVTAPAATRDADLRLVRAWAGGGLRGTCPVPAGRGPHRVRRARWAGARARSRSGRVGCAGSRNRPSQLPQYRR